jgi:CRISPR-associated endoribonuclease Cas6
MGRSVVISVRIPEELKEELERYNLKPVTVVIGEDGKGNLRITRGFVGWMEFDIVYEKLKRAVTKYLLVTSVLGIGRSRGVGFGEVRVELKDQS